MARIVIPVEFLKQELLFKAVKEKYDGLSPLANPLTAFLVQQGIDLNADSAAMTLAAAHHKAQKERSGSAENRTEQRNLKFGPVMAAMRGYYQFLKKLYAPVHSEVGLWGAPITTSGRIAYSSKFAQQLAIFRQLQTKYSSYTPAGSSPLDPYLTLHGQTMAANSTAADEANALHTEAKRLAGQAELATQMRNNASRPVVQHLRAIGGFLLSLYTTNPKEVGLWGFVIDDSPRAPKQMMSRVKLGDQRTVRVIVGGSLANIGSVPLLVYRGKTTAGTAIAIEPGEVWEIRKGHSILTVRNPSTTTAGRFSALRVS